MTKIKTIQQPTDVKYKKKTDTERAVFILAGALKLNNTLTWNNSILTPMCCLHLNFKSG